MGVAALLISIPPLCTVVSGSRSRLLLLVLVCKHTVGGYSWWQLGEAIVAEQRCSAGAGPFRKHRCLPEHARHSPVVHAAVPAATRADGPVSPAAVHMCECPAAACECVLLDGMWDRGAWLPWLITLLASAVADCLTPAGFSCGRHPLKPSTGRPPTFPACTSALTLAGQPAQLEQRGCGCPGCVDSRCADMLHLHLG
jgi:hypothetical protein